MCSGSAERGDGTRPRCDPEDHDVVAGCNLMETLLMQ